MSNTTHAEGLRRFVVGVVAAALLATPAALFGDIFARDNLDWQSRELATVGALAALPGVESQLQSHIRISMNVGLTAAQLRQVADVMAERGQPEAARRTRTAIDSHLAAAAPQNQERR